jgi:hypothetical protein
MSEEKCAVDLTPMWKHRAREMRHEAAFQLYLLYCRTLYRPHMRLLHHYGRHSYTHLNLEGTHSLWCQWCGHRKAQTETSLDRKHKCHAKSF